MITCYILLESRNGTWFSWSLTAAKNWAVRRKKWHILTVSRKEKVTVKNLLVTIKVNYWKSAVNGPKLKPLAAKAMTPLRPSYISKEFFLCITSISHLGQNHAICLMINHMCISKWGHQRPTISKDKNMMRKPKKKQNDKMPRARIWTLTTDCNMVRSNALPTELRGTCQH